MSFFNELRRRNVFKVAAAYIIVGWLIMQGGEVMAPALRLPDWINSALAFFLILGFPLAMFFAWAFEMTPEGLKKEKDIDRSQSLAITYGQKLNYAIIALLTVALVYFVWQSRFQLNEITPATTGVELVDQQSTRQVDSDYLRTLWFNGDYEKAIPLAEQAVQRFPDEEALKSHLGRMYIYGKGDLTRARILLDEMKPVAANEYVSLATTLPLLERDFDQALAAWDVPEAIRFSDYRSSRHGWRGRAVGEIYYLLGETEKAAAVLREFVASENTHEMPVAKSRAFQLGNQALALAMLGDSIRARELMDQAITTIESVGDHFASRSIQGLRARLSAITGQREQALLEIERLLDTPGSDLSRWMLNLDPRWDFFRDDVRFSELIRPKNLQELAE